MNERNKLVLLSVAVVVLIGLAVFMGLRTMRGTAEPTVSKAFLRLSPAEQERQQDDGERQRRAVGKAPSRHLPEDPPGYPPGSQ